MRVETGTNQSKTVLFALRLLAVAGTEQFKGVEIAEQDVQILHKELNRVGGRFQEGEQVASNASKCKQNNGSGNKETYGEK